MFCCACLLRCLSDFWEPIVAVSKQMENVACHDLTLSKRNMLAIGPYRSSFHAASDGDGFRASRSSLKEI